jgi:amino acid adenylation domain-containing protein
MDDPTSRDKVVHTLFEKQAATTPDAVALSCTDGLLSYAQLNQRANRLAHHLLRRGVARGSLIGLCPERSPEAIVGLLGILKAGAAYVPLDPAYPDERLAFMLRDTDARWILAHLATTDRIASLAGKSEIIALDTALNDDLATNPAVDVVEDDLAYVMYTSGSTGTPKGVLVNHRAIVRLVRDTDYCHFGFDEVFLHHSPLAFDASTFEIWGPLLNGSRLALLPPGPPTVAALDAAIRRHDVTTLWLTAGLFHLVVEQRVEILAELRQLVAGGDVLSPSHVARALDALRDGAVINGYGPTESTTFACCFRMIKGYRPGASIPIGRPIAGTTAYVLDERRQLVPAGAPGELYVGGEGVARGYLNQPELTRDRFVADPFATDPAARLYRTGDRVRELPDGCLEFLGRFDNQLKIMGHRIEPGEIEAVLSNHPEVRQAVVVARTPSHGEKQLVGYVVPVTPSAFSAEALKAYLATRLPAYMVPAQILALEHLPLTPNGKIDRGALPAAERPRPAATGPATELEAQLVALWAHILHCDVGPEENFFDLGGTSLQLLEVHAELTKLLGRNLAVTELFDYSSVRALAKRLAGTSNPDPALAGAQARADRQKDAFARQRRFKGNRA